MLPCAVCEIGSNLALSWVLSHDPIFHSLWSFLHVVPFPLCDASCQVFWQRPMKSNALGELMEELKLLFVGRYLRNGFKLPLLWNSGICIFQTCLKVGWSLGDGLACSKP